MLIQQNFNRLNIIEVIDTVLFKSVEFSYLQSRNIVLGWNIEHDTLLSCWERTTMDPSSSIYLQDLTMTRNSMHTRCYGYVISNGFIVYVRES